MVASDEIASSCSQSGLVVPIPLSIQDSFAPFFQQFRDLLNIFRLHSDFFQSSAKVLDKQVEVRGFHTVISGLGMRNMNVFAGVHSSAEEHGKEHNLPGAKVRHVSFCEEPAEVIILQNLVIEAFRRSLDCLMSADQFI